MNQLSAKYGGRPLLVSSSASSRSAALISGNSRPSSSSTDSRLDLWRAWTTPENDNAQSEESDKHERVVLEKGKGGVQQARQLQTGPELDPF